MLKYNYVTGDVFIDALFDENTSKSKWQFTCDNLFVTELGYTHIFPMKSKVDMHHAMKHFLKNFGLHQTSLSTLQGGNDLKAYNVPMVLWCYFSERCSNTINSKSRENYHLNGQNPHTFITGQPMDNSASCELGW